MTSYSNAVYTILSYQLHVYNNAIALKDFSFIVKAHWTIASLYINFIAYIECTSKAMCV